MKGWIFNGNYYDYIGQEIGRKNRHYQAAGRRKTHKNGRASTEKPAPVPGRRHQTAASACQAAAR